jgi:uncharacterized FAD-dependent dehydrogenase
LRKDLNITVSPRQAAEKHQLYPILSRKLKVGRNRIKEVVITRRSIDARRDNIRINLRVEVYIDEKATNIERKVFSYQDVSKAYPVVVVGSGPAGLFSALRLIELGLRPIVFERGKDVSERKRDIAAIHKDHIVDPDSNYGFGEGGAGTFSDGKLFTRSKKRGDVRKILEVLHFHGAQDEILIDSHPHIGTNILPKVISHIRESILNAGGEIHFNSRVTDFIISDGTIKGVELINGRKQFSKAVILATGHSARDIYDIFRVRDIFVEPKPFAMGVRVEHPQNLIDRIQYHGKERGAYLPAATYSFAEQVHGRGMYSFCMCPGGVVVPAATSPGEMVVNGMSPSARSGDFANSGMVVEVRLSDIPKEYSHFNKFAGLRFQEDIEKRCFRQAGEKQFAPAQRLFDFLRGKVSSSLPVSSYKPGIVSSPMHEWLPSFISEGLQSGFKRIGKKAKGFLSDEAVIMGVESRTSSPLRIPRDESTFEHVQIKGLFPCGEGAGYAGGIVSSAIDGERCAEMVVKLYK